MILITVIITTYNAEHFLKRALDSVFAQHGINTIFEFEVIIVDDLSKDKTKEIASTYNVIFLENKVNSGGPNKGRNWALSIAKGNYIAFIDHDDEWLPNKTINQLKYIKNEKVISGGYIDIDTKLNIKRVYCNKSHEGFVRYNTNTTFLSKLKRDKKGQISYMATLMIHHDLKNILFEEQFGMSDYEWMLHIFYNQPSLELTEPVFVRYVDGSNLSLNEKYRLNDYEISKNAIKKFITKYKEASIGLKNLNGSLARYYYLVGNTKKARSYFLKSNLQLKNILYYLTTFVGRSFVIKKFKVFG